MATTNWQAESVEKKDDYESNIHRAPSSEYPGTQIDPAEEKKLLRRM